MQPKYPGMNVPANSTFVHWHDVDADVVSAWHQVYWSPQPQNQDELAYAYADAHFHYAWTINDEFVFCEDESEAVQFALLFGVG